MSALGQLWRWISGLYVGSRIVVRRDSDETYWAYVKDLPGCFASGRTLDELTEALAEAVVMYGPHQPGSAR